MSIGNEAIARVEQAVRHLKEDVRTYKEELAGRRQEFDLANSELYAELHRVEEHLRTAMQELTDMVLQEHEFSGETKPTEYIQVKMFKQRPTYKESDALEWCRENMPVAIEETVNKQMFESYPRLDELEFVEIPEPKPKVQISQKL